MIALDGNKGVISGTLNQTVFNLSRMLKPCRWVRGELHFEVTNENIDIVQRHLNGAVWAKKFEPPSAVLPVPLEDHIFKRPPIGRQLSAFQKGRKLEAFGLFMWMGTGKTFVALNLAARWWQDGIITQVIVAAPKGVDKQWLERQLPQHMPEWCPWHGVLYRSGKKLLWPDESPGLRWMFMNIESWSSGSGQAAARGFVESGPTLIIIDESTRIKTPGAERAKFAVKLGNISSVKKKMILSGLPVTRGIEDLFMQFKFLDPGIIGSKSYFGFKHHYCLLGGWQAKQIVGYQNIPELLTNIEPYCFIAPREAGTPTTMIEREHGLTPQQKQLYRDIKTELLGFIRDHQGVHGNDKLIAAAHAGASLIKLQQITNGYITTESGELIILSRERFELTGDIVEEAGEQRKLIFCRFHHDLNFVGEELTKRNIRWGEYSGRNPTTRDDELARLKRGDLETLVMTAASGGVGLDVPEASCAVYFSNSFDFEHRTQSLFRMDRVGQTRDITIVDIFGAPIDRLIFKSYQKKGSVSDIVMSLTEEDL